jgi:glycosyltransferase involved in cell wall biosynthesis
MIDVTVIFATRNGSDVLNRTLSGFAAVAGHDRHWKMIAVDNGSTDATPEILSSFASRLPLTVLNQPLPGKNRALNLALREAEGGFYIFSDDDAVPHEGFLQNWRDAVAKQDAFDLFGGSIEPTFDTAPASWMLEHEYHFEELYALRRGQEGPIPPSLIFGPNMAVRSSLFATGMRFDETIGPSGADKFYPMGSENEFCLRASRSGHKSWFTDKPKVDHIVRPYQMTEQYFRARAYRLGRGVARTQWQGGQLQADSKRYSALVAHMKPTLRRAKQLYFLSKTFFRKPEQKFNATWEYDFHRGFYDEFERQQRQPHAAGVLHVASSCMPDRAP